MRGKYVDGWASTLHLGKKRDICDPTKLGSNPANQQFKDQMLFGGQNLPVDVSQDVDPPFNNEYVHMYKNWFIFVSLRRS